MATDFSLNPSLLELDYLPASSCPSPLPAPGSCVSYATPFTVYFVPPAGTVGPFSAVPADSAVSVTRQPSVTGNVGSFDIVPTRPEVTAVRLRAADGRYQDLVVGITTLRITVDATALGANAGFRLSLEYADGSSLAFSDPAHSFVGGAVYTFSDVPAYQLDPSLPGSGSPSASTFTFSPAQQLVETTLGGTTTTLRVTFSKGADNAVRLAVPPGS